MARIHEYGRAWSTRGLNFGIVRERSNHDPRGAITGLGHTSTPRKSDSLGIVECMFWTHRATTVLKVSVTQVRDVFKGFDRLEHGRPKAHKFFGEHALMERDVVGMR
ncbi:hypothetical protein Scep_016774 [Stephania cephalantha]|uniref:Uncharacterized protein n=1 Tax=Stephania cephalantha TaxID=152367 RepID=A0AAP0IQ34_9MAGN